MKVNPETLTVLKNFAVINSGIWVDAGSTLKTISTAKNILATATIKDTFPESFGIYDLTEFLSVLSIHKDGPELDFDGKHVIIKGLKDRSKIKYRVTDKTMLTVPPDKKIKFPDPEVEFTLYEDDFNWIINAAKVLKTPNIAITSDGETVSFVAFNYKDDSAHTDSLDLHGVEGNGHKYHMFYKTEDFSKMVPGTYDVKFGRSGISSFQHTSIDLHYYMMFESDSKFED